MTGITNPTKLHPNRKKSLAERVGRMGEERMLKVGTINRERTLNEAEAYGKRRIGALLTSVIVSIGLVRGAEALFDTEEGVSKHDAQVEAKAIEQSEQALNRVLVLREGVNLRSEPVSRTTSDNNPEGTVASTIGEGQVMVIDTPLVYEELVTGHTWYGFSMPDRQGGEPASQAEATFWIDIDGLRSQVGSDGQPLVETYTEPGAESVYLDVTGTGSDNEFYGRTERHGGVIATGSNMSVDGLQSYLQTAGLERVS